MLSLKHIGEDVFQYSCNNVTDPNPIVSPLTNTFLNGTDEDDSNHTESNMNGRSNSRPNRRVHPTPNVCVETRDHSASNSSRNSRNRSHSRGKSLRDRVLRSSRSPRAGRGNGCSSYESYRDKSNSHRSKSPAVNSNHDIMNGDMSESRDGSNSRP